MKLSNRLYVAGYKKPNENFPDNPARKVGITGGGSSTKYSRMNQLSNGTEAYSPIEAIQLWEFPDNLSVKDVETFIHNCLDIFNLRTNREWFDGKTIENNTIEDFVYTYIQDLIAKGYDIKAIHETIDENDNEKEIISDDDEKIKIRGARRALPKKVTLNGESITFTSFKDLYKEVFKYLVDKEKITKENCPITKDNSIVYLVNIKSEGHSENPFLGPFEYKDLYLETHGSANTMINRSKFLVEKFGDNEIILNIVE